MKNKFILLIILLFGLKVNAQTVGIHTTPPLVKNNPNDNSINAYAELINGGLHTGLSYHSRDSLSNTAFTVNFTKTLRTGMFYHVYNPGIVDSLYQWNGSAWIPANIGTPLGFTPENVANKATSFSTLNNTLYPTTQAVQNLFNTIGNTIYTGNGTISGNITRNVNIGNGATNTTLNIQDPINNTGIFFNTASSVTTLNATTSDAFYNNVAGLYLASGTVSLDAFKTSGNKHINLTFASSGVGGISIRDDISYIGMYYQGVYFSTDPGWLTPKRYVDSLVATVGSGTTAQALTVNNSGTGTASPFTFNGGVAKTISYNSIGAIGNQFTAAQVGANAWIDGNIKVDDGTGNAALMTSADNGGFQIQTNGGFLNIDNNFGSLPDIRLSYSNGSTSSSYQLGADGFIFSNGTSTGVTLSNSSLQLPDNFSITVPNTSPTITHLLIGGLRQKVGIGPSVTPTAYLHLAASSGAPGTGSLKINSGTLLGTPEDGAMEYGSSHLYFTIGGTRYQLDQQGGGVVTSVSGTASRVTSTGGTTPVIDISSTFEALLGKVANPLSQFASTTSAQLATVLSDESGTGVVAYTTNTVFTTPNLGTPSALVGTNITGIGANFTAGNATLAANLSGTPALPNGTTATTQTFGDNTTKLATDAFVQAAIPSLTGFVPYTGATGNVNLGSNFISAGSSLTPLVALHAISTVSTNPRGILSDQNTADAVGARITMRKSRGTPGSPTVITTGDILGSWTASGYTNAYTDAGKVLVTSTGTISNGIVPSIMELQTMNSAGTLTDGIKIDQAQALTFGAYGTGLLHSGSSGSITSSLLVNADITTGTIANASLANPAITLNGTSTALGGTFTVTTANTDTTTTGFRTAANSRTLAQTQTALNLKANLASPTFTGTVSAAAITATGLITAQGGFTTNGNISAAAFGNTTPTSVTSPNVYFSASTLTDNTSAGSTTYNYAGGTVWQPTTFASTNAITVTNGGTVFIGGDAINGTNTTVTNKYGLINVGKSLFVGNITANGTTTMTGAIVTTLQVNTVGNTGVNFTEPNSANATSTTAASYLPSGISTLYYRISAGGPGTNTTMVANASYAGVIGPSSLIQTTTSGTSAAVTGYWDISPTLVKGTGSTITDFYTRIIEAPIAPTGSGTLTNTAGSLWAKGNIRTDGNLTLGTAGNRLFITEGANGIVGQTTLVSGTKAITITGLTTSSRAIITFVSVGGTVTTTWQYAGICTSNTLTITALTNANTTNTSDTSVINYEIIN